MQRLIRRVVDRGQAAIDVFREREGDLSLRYILCTEPDAWLRVLRGELASIPTTQGLPVLVENDVLEFHRFLSPSGKWGRHLGHRRGERVYGSVTEYKARYPAAQDLPQYENPHFGYQIQRAVGAGEVLEQAERDPSVRQLLDLGVPPEEILLALFYRHQYCGPGSEDLVEFYEHLVLRPIAGVFLLLTNNGDRAVDLHGLVGSTPARAERRARPLASAYEGPKDSVKLSAPPLEAGSSMLIPVATLLRPFGRISYAEYARAEKLHSQDKDLSRFWTIRRMLSQVPGLNQRHQIVGPSWLPAGLLQGNAPRARAIPVRPFDVERVSALDTVTHGGLEAGSCPHLFFVHRRTGALHYAGEVLTGHPGRRSEVTVTVPPQAGLLVIAELEEEVTELYGIWRDGERLLPHRLLHKGDSVCVSVAPAQVIQLVGRYHVGAATPVRQLPEDEKRSRVHGFIESFSA